AAGEDAGRGVDRDLVEAAVDGQGDDGVEPGRIKVDARDAADGDAADLDRRVGTQLADLGEARGDLVAVARQAEAAVGGGDGQHQQRGQRQHEEGADGEFETGATGCHWGHLDAAGRGGLHVAKGKDGVRRMRFTGTGRPTARN